MIRKVSGGYVVYSESGKKLSRVYKTKAQAKKRLQQIEYFKHRNKKYKRKIDKKMRGAYGEIDYDNGVIRINPRKGELLNTILHEEEHRLYPNKTEREVRKSAEKKESELTISKAINLLKKYMRRRKNG